MNRIKKRKCRHCRCLFVPDPRNRDRQKYCSKEPCRTKSKASSQKKWLNKPENQNYFRDPDNVKRVQRWREKNPGYWKRPREEVALQDSLGLQPAENKEHINQNDANALQDLLTSQPAVIIGLISNFIGSALQDDIADTLLAMQQSGQDILCPQLKKQGGANDCKIPDLKTSRPPDTQELQLGRSPTGSGPAY